MERTQRIEKCATTFRRVLADTPAVIPGSGSLAGPLVLNREPLQRETGQRPDFGADNLHFPLNLATLLRLGVPGIEREARVNLGRAQGEAATYLGAIADTYRVVGDWITRHAQEARARAASSGAGDKERLLAMAGICEALARRAPATFREAVQLFWFASVIRGHGTIGRLDQHLFPFYGRDLLEQRITRAEAFDLLCELWRRMNEVGTGDTLRNLMIGGLDAQGRDAANDLSALMIEVSLAVRQPEPHLNVRLHRHSSLAFRNQVVELIALGHGQGTIYNDDVLVPSLVSAGVPIELAREYANDGCSEVVIDGKSGIHFVLVEALKALELALFNGESRELPGEPEGHYWAHHPGPRKLHSRAALGFQSGDFASMTTFEEFFEAYWRQYRHQLDRQLDELRGALGWARDHAVAPPFLGGLLPETLATGCDPYRGGFPVECAMVFSGGFPPVADSLAAVRQVVFEDRACSPAELLEALRADFQGYEQLRRRLQMAPKFGNDVAAVDDLAAELVRRFCRHVRSAASPSGRPFWPAIFDFLFNDHAKLVGAMPDGRRWKDPVGEHFSPTPGRARRGPTAVLRSAAKAPLAEACGTAVVNLSLSRSVIPDGEKGRTVVRHLIDAALSMGLPVLNVAIYDVQALREAQRCPEHHGDLVVRVWGYSARFVDLAPDMQEHIMKRAVEQSPC